MPKADRIPAAWPAAMTDVVAAAYLDMAVSTFHALIADGQLPAGIAVPGRRLVRWSRDDLDAAITAWRAGSLDAGDDAGPPFTPTPDGDPFMDALDAEQEAAE